MTVQPKPVDRAAEFRLPELFFSITDRKGRITACNDVFLRIAGFTSEQMLGAPHNIVRHPDMPKCVFQRLWDYLLGGRSVGAYVKNLTSTGEYYWVYALVLPTEGGFLSIRLKPTSAILGTVQELYAQLLATEQSHGTDWREGLRSAGVELDEALASLGHESYDEFMVDSLREEICARNDGLGPRPRSQIACVFDELAPLEQLRQEATQQVEDMAIVSRSLTRIALNAGICAARLDERGHALAVLSEHASRVAADISTEVQVLDAAGRSLASTLEETSFNVSLATLVLEMSSSFRAEVATCEFTADQQAHTYGASSDALSTLLETTFDGARASVRQGVQHLDSTVRSFEHSMVRFARLLLTTRINHVTGRSIIANLPDGEQYSNLLDEMAIIAESARTKLEALQVAAMRVDRMLARWLKGPLAA